MSFVQKIKDCVTWFVPYGIIMRRRRMDLENYYKTDFVEQQLQKEQKKQEIKNYFLSLDATSVGDPEIIEIINYLKKYRFLSIPYDFSRKYHAMDIDVFYDTRANVFYVLHKNKRLYFPRGWEIERIRAYYNGLCIEQDEDSPHRYETEAFSVREGDAIVDVGAAEGIWALDGVERAGKIYLFECTEEWIEALRRTFEPWKEKVVIVNKFVSNTNDVKNVTLDNFFKGKRIDFIKADIEGMEIKLLEGGKDILTSASGLKLLLCAYHAKIDGTEIKKILEGNGFETEYSKGYMLFISDRELEKPYIRRGLIRAMKKEAP